jgi:hypothetical protein
MSGTSGSGGPRASGGAGASAGRIDVRKTYKLYIGGAFPRTESGRTYVVRAGGAPAGDASAARTT